MNNIEIDRLLARLELPELQYKADMMLHDESQQFSGELLKISLAGIAAVGIFIGYMADKHMDLVLGNALVGCMAVGSVIGFAATAAVSMMHRFLSQSSHFHHINYLKLVSIQTTPPDDEIEKRTQGELKGRESRFMRCDKALKLAAVLMIISAMLMGGFFIGIWVTANINRVG